MGKYDHHITEQDSRGIIEPIDYNSNMLIHIANELAEMNRLKRIELSHSTWENKHGVQFWFTETDNLEDGHYNPQN